MNLLTRTSDFFFRSKFAFPCMLIKFQTIVSEVKSQGIAHCFIEERHIVLHFYSWDSHTHPNISYRFLLWNRERILLL